MIVLLSFSVLADTNITGNDSAVPDDLDPSLNTSDSADDNTSGDNFTDDINMTLGDNETQPEDDNNQTLNETPDMTNQTDEKNINLDLEYKSGTEWDSDNNGIEPITGVIDFDVSHSSFSWLVDESNLCTKWEVYSYNNDTTTRTCYGSEKCCALMDLNPSLDSWDDPLDLHVGRYGVSLFNMISAQVIYADYELSADEPYAVFLQSDVRKLTAQFLEPVSAAFDRDMECKGCSNHKVPPLTEFVMVVRAGLSRYIEGVLTDYFPSAFTVINAMGGVVTEVNEDYSRIEWNISGDDITKNYTLLSPNRTTPTSKYDFHSEVGDQRSDDWMVVVADPGIAEEACSVPDVDFKNNDLTSASGSAVFEKGGVRLVLNGASTDRIKDFPTLKDGILSVHSSINVDNATIEIPHCGVSPVTTKPRLYVREDGGNFVEAEPYCLNKTVERKSNVTVNGVCDKEKDPHALMLKTL